MDGIYSSPSGDAKMNSNNIGRARTFLVSEGRVHGLEGLADPGPEGSFLLEHGVQMVLFFVVVHRPEGHGGAYEGARERKSGFVAGAVVEAAVHCWIISGTKLPMLVV